MLIMSSILVTSKSNVMTLILQFSPLTTRIPYAKTLTEISFQHPLVVGSALSMSGTETAVINVTRMYNFSDESGIFSFWGEFLSPNEPERKSESVFIRMVFETDRIGYLCNVERFKDESRFYLDHVVSSPFHGCGLPRFYGSYETTFYTKPKPSDSKLKCGCIIVQDCGVPDTSLIDSDEEFRSKAIELLIKLHKYGIRHGSITWTGTNISDLGGAPFFNDLSLARIHNCQDKAIEVTGDILEVDTDYLQCGELKDILRIISFTLYPDYFEWYGYIRYYSDVYSLHDIFQGKRTRRYRGRSFEYEWKHAVDTWTHLRNNWGVYHDGEAPALGDTSLKNYLEKYGKDSIEYVDS